jgi:hypothetical protein
MILNLEPIPGNGDGRAREIIHGFPQVVDASLAKGLDDDARLAPSRYGCRATTLASTTELSIVCVRPCRQPHFGRPTWRRVICAMS